MDTFVSLLQNFGKLRVNAFYADATQILKYTKFFLFIAKFQALVNISDKFALFATSKIVIQGYITINVSLEKLFNQNKSDSKEMKYIVYLRIKILKPSSCNAKKNWAGGWHFSYKFNLICEKLACKNRFTFTVEILSLGLFFQTKSK